MLTGYKTYVLGAVGVLSALAGWMGWIDVATVNHILELVIPAGLVTLRLALP